MKCNSNKDFLDSVFPFHILVNDQFKIIDTGRSIFKILPNLTGKNLLNVFFIKRPQINELDYHSLISFKNQILILYYQDEFKNITFKGQLIEFQGNKILFLITPWITKVEELSTLGLSIADFALSDPTTDLLQLIKVNEIATKDIRRLVHELKRSENKFSNIFQKSNDAVFIHEANGEIVDVNLKGIEMFGYKKMELINMRISYLLTNSNLKKYNRLLYEILKKGSITKELLLVNKSGDTFTGHLSANSLKIGGVMFIQSIIRDISQIKEKEIQLVKAKKIAEESAKTKQRFLANMSHEIRTPLNGIMGIANLLSKSNLSEKQQKYIKSIETSSETLMVVINDILDIAKIDAGKLKIDVKKFSLTEAVYSVIEIFTVKAIEKAVDLTCNIDKRIPDTLLGDPIRLSQILFNLIGNAIKFTEKGIVELNIKAYKTYKTKVSVEFEVKDTGIGIPKSKLKTIFKPFIQVNDKTDREYGGTGLGLTIVKKLVELQFGKLNIKSEPNVGTSCNFKLSFPVVYENMVIEKPKPKNQDVSLENIKILLVEDNPINQIVTKDLLEENKMLVAIAKNGEEALFALEKINYDVVLMDMQMPVMDGYTAIKHIRAKNNGIQNIPILALTAHVTEGEIEKCEKAGADEYLSKPFRPNDLIDKIRYLYKLTKPKSRKS